MNPHYSATAERAGHRCEYCRAPEAVFNFPFEVEHVIPVSRFGPDLIANTALACRACNLFKSDHEEGIDPETGSVQPLFNPRRDQWHIHFRIDRENGVIIGLSGCGRATIERLRLNSPLQVVARLAWMKIGIFP